MCENGDYTDTVDPRVHIELERLNSATDEINRLEVELDEARNSFRALLCESSAKVEAIRLKLGMCVERAKPYYEARFAAKEALKLTQTAAQKFEKANSAHSAAREMVYLAEQGLGGRTLDPAWQEMLNHATQRVNDAEHERSAAEIEHRIACVKHDAANVKVQSLQKELKRAITKSSLRIRRALMQFSSLLNQHEMMFLPYYEMKATFNHHLEQQKARVQYLESQVASSKLTYSEALRNLEQISDEIHRTRRKASMLLAPKQRSLESNASYLDDAQELLEEYKSLPQKLSNLSSPITNKMEEVDGFKNIPLTPASDKNSEWTEISLDSSPDEETKLNQPQDFTSIKSKMKLDTNISNWISRSSLKEESKDRRQSLDNLLGPTSEKVKEIFSQGMMMLNISSLSERRNSEPKLGLTESRTPKKIPSPLEKTLTYLAAEEDSSDTESLCSVDMLNEEQIHSLMLDKEIGNVCEQVLGTPINEIVTFATCSANSSQINKQ